MDTQVKKSQKKVEKKLTTAEKDRVIKELSQKSNFNFLL